MPATWLFLAINIVMLVVLDLTGGASEPANLLRFGAKYGPAIADGQYWRLFTAIFLHVSLFHLLTNSIGLVIFGKIVESNFSTRTFASIYLLSGVFGNIASYAASPDIGVGASGAIFGIVGAYAAYLVRNRGELRESATGTLIALLILVAIDLFYGLTTPGIDNWAHVGGLSSGFVLSMYLSPRVSEYMQTEVPGMPFVRRIPVIRRPSTSSLVATIGVFLVIAAALVWLIGRDYPYSVPAQIHHFSADALGLVQQGDYRDATQDMLVVYRLESAQRRPGLAELVRALSAAALGQSQAAQVHANRAIQLGLSPDAQAVAQALNQQLGGAPST